MKKAFLSYLQYETIYFSFLFIIILLLFRNAFTIDFFLDDYFFLKVGKADSIMDFMTFFSPFKDYFFRPIPTEMFYFLINLFNRNLLFAHGIVFLTFFLGLVFLYKCSIFITKNKYASYLFTGMYAVHFTHVFQLYQVATAIEIALFTFLVVSFYLFLKKKYILSGMFFIFALLSKETAVLYPLALVIYLAVSKARKRNNKIVGVFFLLALLFILIYKYGTSHVVSIDTYAIQWNLRLITNNIIWYTLWGMGIPNFVPNYIKSIIFAPLPDFWNLFTSTEIKLYFYLLIFYFMLLASIISTTLSSSKEKIKKYIIPVALLLFFFMMFISPTLPIIHRWMVRLTLPLIFLVGIQSFVIYKGLMQKGLIKSLSVIAVVMFVFINYLGTQIHESSGLFLLNSETVKNSRSYFKTHKNEMVGYNRIYFVDSSKNALLESRNFKNLFHGQDFIPFVIGDKNIKVLYDYETQIIPQHTYVIDSREVLRLYE